MNKSNKKVYLPEAVIMNDALGELGLVPNGQVNAAIYVAILNGKFLLGNQENCVTRRTNALKNANNNLGKDMWFADLKAIKFNNRCQRQRY